MSSTSSSTNTRSRTRKQQGDSRIPVRVDMSDVMQKDEFHGLMRFVYQGNILVEEELTEEMTKMEAHLWHRGCCNSRTGTK